MPSWLCDLLIEDGEGGRRGSWPEAGRHDPPSGRLAQRAVTHHRFDELETPCRTVACDDGDVAKALTPAS
ncbi:hypothetical protein [Rhodovulum sp. 12E13]|uniref:hypothetical protein n=1 Tax=Rhodovulum sp. 12E13 TaxID=2203891 RepID=UPI001313E5A5|nr:hypothetical protein [Rhodovulum sp. 12E13]